ncbi:hypothetical protein SJI19_16685 [Acerihabitans sp. TG2]|uniref:hypothetical protein n=1 Tax=Acerihabitans sp. TG2 TaxID=3096008 RepID=UPI002B227D3C|nr:hypothetical protein [Acerihabitans sp. TG2]MEA9392162.1 hypothetical protein [Acerihabitans sp. TG2]
MKQRGIESSVTEIFGHELRLSCMLNGIDDLTLSFNGSDRDFNADNMFTACDIFFIVEMKSRIYNIKDESKKTAVYKLCEGLIATPQIRSWHRQCHYIMWGEDITSSNNIRTKFSIYEDSVCRPSVLPRSQTLVEPSSIVTNTGEFLASSAVAGTIGLRKPCFFYYLNWLLTDRSGLTPPLSPNDKLPVILIGNSARRRVFGKKFSTYTDFNIWADQALKNKIRDKGHGI